MLVGSLTLVQLGLETVMGRLILILLTALMTDANRLKLSLVQRETPMLVNPEMILATHVVLLHEQVVPTPRLLRLFTLMRALCGTEISAIPRVGGLMCVRTTALEWKPVAESF